MFKRSIQRQFARFNSHGHTSKYINDLAYKPDLKKGQEYIKQYEERLHHSEGVTNMWKKVTYFVAIPAILLTAIPVGITEMHHAEHRKHQAELSDDEWPTQYDYMNIRSKKFFWGDGDKTLFWNDACNRHVEA